MARAALALTWGAARRDVVVVLALHAAAAVLVLLELLVARSVLELLLAGPRPSDSALVQRVVALALLVAGSVACGALVADRTWLLGERVAAAAQQRLLAATARAPLAAFDDPSFYDRLERARLAAAGRPLQLVTALASSAGAALSLGGVAAGLLALEPALVPILASGGVAVALTNRRRGRDRYRFEHDTIAATRDRIYLQQLLTDRSAAGELRVHGTLAALRQRHGQLWEARLRGAAQVAARRQRVALVGAAGLSAAAVATMLALVWLVATGRTPLATAGAAAVGVQQGVARLRAGTASAALAHEALLFLRDLVDFVDPGSTPAGRGAVRALPTAFSSVRMRGVTFTYPGAERPALVDVDLDVRAGEIVAIVGENGSGKTTLAKLLAGLYEPTSGSLSFVADPTAPAGRTPVTVVFQDFLQLQLSAVDNVTAGEDPSSVDDARVRDAVVRAGAAPYLDALEGAYTTRLSRLFATGTELSLGQWQRIALARAYYRDATLLVLDEPTASLDPVAEQELFGEVRRLAGARTVVLITHRMASARLADRAVVLSEGRVVETGTHDALLARRGPYHRLFTTQAAAYGLGGSGEG